MKHLAVAIVAVAVVAVGLAAIGWQLWDSESGPHVDDVAGAYHFDPRPDLQAYEPEPNNALDAQLAQWMKQGLKTSELTLHPDRSLTFKLTDVWVERGRWLLKDHRVFVYIKPRGRRERLIPKEGWLAREGTLVTDYEGKPLVLRRQ